MSLFARDHHLARLLLLLFFFFSLLLMLAASAGISFFFSGALCFVAHYYPFCRFFLHLYGQPEEEWLVVASF